MILYYIGLTVSAIFFLISFIFFLIGIYFDFDSYNSQKPLPSLKVSLKYHLGCAMAFGLALFTFLTTEIGVSWDSMCGSTGLMVLISVIIIIDKFIRLKTRNYLYKQDISFLSIWSSEKNEIDKSEK